MDSVHVWKRKSISNRWHKYLPKTLWSNPHLCVHGPWWWHEASATASTHLVLFVLTSVRKAGNDCGDSARWRNLAGVDHDQELHEVVVDLSTTALNDVHVFASDGLLYLNAVRSVKNTVTLLHSSYPPCDHSQRSSDRRRKKPYAPRWAYQVSRLLNFRVTTRPRSMPSRSTILWARSGWDEPLNSLMFGISGVELIASRSINFRRGNRGKSSLRATATSQRSKRLWQNRRTRTSESWRNNGGLRSTTDVKESSRSRELLRRSTRFLWTMHYLGLDAQQNDDFRNLISKTKWKNMNILWSPPDWPPFHQRSRACEFRRSILNV